MSSIISQSLKSNLCTLIDGRAAAVVCIGTDLLSGDCLGPLVGQFLIELGVPAYVYGNLESPVSALNIDKIGGFVSARHPDRVIIAVDSAVGPTLGKITVCKGPLRPGSAGGKSLKPVGDISITAVTTRSLPHQEGFALVPLGLVYKLARTVAATIHAALVTRPHYKENSFISLISS